MSKNVGINADCLTKLTMYEMDSLISELVREDEHVYIISDRSYDDTDIIAQWLEDNEIEHELLVLTNGGSLLPVVGYFNFSTVIDDRAEFFEEMHNSDMNEVELICIDNNNNKDCYCHFRVDKKGGEI